MALDIDLHPEIDESLRWTQDLLGRMNLLLVFLQFIQYTCRVDGRPMSVQPLEDFHLAEASRFASRSPAIGAGSFRVCSLLNQFIDQNKVTASRGHMQGCTPLVPANVGGAPSARLARIESESPSVSIKNCRRQKSLCKFGVIFMVVIIACGDVV